MLKVYNIVKALPEKATVNVVSADATELLIGTAEDILLDDSNLSEWALGNTVKKYEVCNSLHMIYTENRFEELPRVSSLLSLVSGIKYIGVHFDDYNEIYTPKELIRQHGDMTVTGMHICEKDMRDDFDIELWLG